MQLIVKAQVNSCVVEKRRFEILIEITQPGQTNEYNRHFHFIHRTKSDERKDQPPFYKISRILINPSGRRSCPYGRDYYSHKRGRNITSSSPPNIVSG